MIQQHIIVFVALSILSVYSQCPPNFSLIGNKEYVIQHTNMKVTFKLCGTLDQGCPGGFCTTKGCSSICQSWPTGAASLGNFTSATIDENLIVLKAVNGDNVIGDNSGPRETYINITCNPQALNDLSNIKFTDATVVNPGHKKGEPWIYYITAESSLACSCQKRTCDECSKSPQCFWCLDAAQCTPFNVASCRNYIDSPSNCPVCANSACLECSLKSCYWCLGESRNPSFPGNCQNNYTYCVGGAVKYPQYCPVPPDSIISLN